MATISSIRFTPASAAEANIGLLGYVSFLIGDGFRVDGVTVRRTRSGHLALSFPERRDAAGRGHPFLRPVDSETLRSVERQVFAALGGLG